MKLSLFVFLFWTAVACAQIPPAIQQIENIAAKGQPLSHADLVELRTETLKFVNSTHKPEDLAGVNLGEASIVRFAMIRSDSNFTSECVLLDIRLALIDAIDILRVNQSPGTNILTLQCELKWLTEVCRQVGDARKAGISEKNAGHINGVYLGRQPPSDDSNPANLLAVRLQFRSKLFRLMCSSLQMTETFQTASQRDALFLIAGVPRDQLDELMKALPAHLKGEP